MSGIKKLLQDRPVAYYPSLARAVGGIAPALFLQQVAHWQGNGQHWVYRTQEELEQELAMSPKVQATCRKHLVDHGYIEEERRAKNRLHYRVRWENVEAALETIPSASQVQSSPSGRSSVAQPEKLINESKDESSVEANASSGGPQSESVVAMEKHVVDGIYRVMDQAGFSLDNTDFPYQLGRAQNMLRKLKPTDEELEALPSWCVSHYEIYGKTDATAALRYMRQQKARSERMSETEPAAWEPVNPQSDAAIAAKAKPRKPVWYASFYPVSEEMAQQWVDDGLSHDDILAILAKPAGDRIAS